jgi:hypothetical protein
MRWLSCADGIAARSVRRCVRPSGCGRTHDDPSIRRGVCHDCITCQPSGRTALGSRLEHGIRGATRPISFRLRRGVSHLLLPLLSVLPALSGRCDASPVIVHGTIRLVADHTGGIGLSHRFQQFVGCGAWRGSDFLCSRRLCRVISHATERTSPGDPAPRLLHSTTVLINR